MKYFLILIILLTYFFPGSTPLKSEELNNLKSIYKYCESCGFNNGTYINPESENNPKNLIITKNRFNGDNYSNPELGFALLKNDGSIAFGIALVRPLFKLF